jgi:hypothetical protein
MANANDPAQSPQRDTPTAPGRTAGRPQYETATT